MIAVIGGGPVGGYFASKVKDVCIYEEHLDIGKPVQCTGIVTSKIFDYVKLDNKFVVNKIKKVRLHSSHNEFSFNLKNKDYIIDRVKFDKKIIDSAVSKGAKLVKGWKFLDYSKGKIKFNKGIVKCNKLVGADGANSLVARKTGLWQDRKFLVGKQALVKGTFEKEVYDVYFDLVKEFFCWVVPENENFARVGCASYNNINNYFDKFLNKFDFKIVNYTSGLIPKFKKIKVYKENVYLIGDAGLFVKDLSIDGNEAVLIKEDDFIKNIRIKELVRKADKVGSKLQPIKHDVFKLKKDIFTYTPTIFSTDLKFRKVSKILKHNINDYLYEIILDKGYRIKITPSHSVMVFDDYKFVPKKVSNLNIQKDKIPLILNIPNNQFSIKLNLLNMILKDASEHIKDIRIIGGRSLIYKTRSDAPSCYRRIFWDKNSIPLSIFLKKGITSFQNVDFTCEGSKKRLLIPNIINVTKEFCRLLGYYAAEGCSPVGNSIRLCFGKNDFDLLKDAVNCVKSVFNIKPRKIITLKNPVTGGGSSYPLVFGGKLLSMFFKKILKTGSYAVDKEIPFVIFNVPNDYKLEFLKGYFRGDGHLRIRKPNLRRNWSAEISVKTASRKLASDLVILSFQLGLFPSIESFTVKERVLYNKKIKESKGYRISFSRKEDLLRLIDLFPNKKNELLLFIAEITEGKETVRIPKEVLTRELIGDHNKHFEEILGNSYYYRYKSFPYLKIKNLLNTLSADDKRFKFINNLIENKIVLLSIKDIKKFKQKNKEVFDLSVPNNNMFIGGVGSILLHNTGGGLYYGVKSADFLAECLNEGKKYYQKDFGHNLWMNYKLRKILDKFSFKDWNYFLKLLNNYNLKDFDRDNVKISNYFNFKLFLFVFRKMIS